jgi:hypothetical protein
MSTERAPARSRTALLGIAAVAAWAAAVYAVYLIGYLR